MMLIARTHAVVATTIVAALLTLPLACSPPGPAGPAGKTGLDGRPGTSGEDGADGSSCSVVHDVDAGVARIECADGTRAVVDDREGATTLVRLDDEPAGEHCDTGGVAVRTGLDDDGDGVLDDAEIDDTTYICGPSLCTYEGDIQINSALGGVALSGCAHVTGSVFIQGAAIRSLAGLEDLRTIGGSLTISSAPELIDLVGLANLELVGGQLSIQNNQALESVGGLDALVGVGGGLYISGNNSLVSLDGFPRLSEVAQLYFGENPQAPGVPAFPMLTSAGSVQISGDAPMLTSLAGLSNLVIAESLYISDLESLQTLAGLSALQTVGSLTITGNAQLPQCLVDDFVEGLTVTGPSNIFGNGGFLPCP